MNNLAKVKLHLCEDSINIINNKIPLDLNNYLFEFILDIYN